MDLGNKNRMRSGFGVAVAIALSACASGAKKDGTATAARPAAAAAEPDPLGLRFPLTEATLANGLRIVMVEDRTVPLVSYQTWVKVGSVDETFGMTGIAHLFEHLMFKGSEKYGPKAFFQELEAKGADVNAFTTRDYTVYHETFIPELLPKVIDLESDRLASLKINDEVFANELQVVFEERRLRVESSPEGRMQEALWGQVFKSHPYRWPVIGYAEDLHRLTTDDLRQFFATYYQPKNVTLVVVGAIDPAATLAMLKGAYGSIPARDRPARRIADEPEQTEPRRMVLNDTVAAERVSVAYRITRADDADTYPLDVLANILFSGVSSRAYRDLVEDRKIALSASGYSFTPTFPGIFVASAVLKEKRKAEDFEAAFEALVKDVQAKGVTKAEVDKAVRQLTVQLVDSVRTANGLANMIGTVTTILGEPNAYRDDLAKYQKVTPEDVLRVARKYLTPARKNVLILRPGTTPPPPMVGGQGGSA